MAKVLNSWWTVLVICALCGIAFSWVDIAAGGGWWVATIILAWSHISDGREKLRAYSIFAIFLLVAIPSYAQTAPSAAPLTIEQARAIQQGLAQLDQFAFTPAVTMTLARDRAMLDQSTELTAFEKTRLKMVEAAGGRKILQGTPEFDQAAYDKFMDDLRPLLDAPTGLRLTHVREADLGMDKNAIKVGTIEALLPILDP